MPTILSLDIPWGGGNYLGAAIGTVTGNTIEALNIAYCNVHHAAPASDPLPEGDAEIDGFIANGAGPGRVRWADANGPFNNMPHNPQSRQDYMNRLWAAFHDVRMTFGTDDSDIDLILVDVPPVPAAISTHCDGPLSSATFRPVEYVFHNKVWIPGANPNRDDGYIQFAKFQAGNINGCRPGYAVFQMASIVFNGVTVVESFPQLILGPLQEMAAELDLAFIHRLNAHKGGNAAQRQAAQDILWPQILSFVGPAANGLADQLQQAPVPARPDVFDALIGLLPGIVYAGFVPPAVPDGPWANAVLLQNHAFPYPAWTEAQDPGQPMLGGHIWIDHAPNFQRGCDDSGILALNLGLWGVPE